VYLSDFLRVLGRRWLIFSVGMLATGFVGWHVLTTVRTDHQATGQMVLLLPPDVGELPTNPYLNLPDGLATVGSLAASHVLALDTVHELADRGYTAEYDVALVPGTGPLLVITTEDKDPAMAVATRDAVMAELNTTIADLQGTLDIPARQVISSQPSNVSSQAEVLPGSRLRALAGAAGAGVLLVLVVTFALDRALALRPSRDPSERTPRRGRRGRARHPDDDLDHGDPAGEDDRVPALAR
jgi:hypothetical protein